MHIIYETNEPIDENTIIKDETIQILNTNGANAKIVSIQSLEKETIILIDVGENSGEFKLKLNGIKNKRGDSIVEKISEEFLIGTRMQRIVASVTNKSGNVDAKQPLERIFDGDEKTYGHWLGYSGSAEILFKKSEKINKISILTLASPSSSYRIKITVLQGGEWKQIEEFTGSLRSGVLEHIEKEIESGVYDGIGISLNYPTSWASIAEFEVYNDI